MYIMHLKDEIIPSKPDGHFHTRIYSTLQVFILQDICLYIWLYSLFSDYVCLVYMFMIRNCRVSVNRIMFCSVLLSYANCPPEY